MREETKIEIRELSEIEEFQGCVDLQREAFGLPDAELSPLRHFVVSRSAGGFTLGAFVIESGRERLIGFVHHLVALRGGEVIGYSHIAAIAAEFQNAGVGAKLKWAQRDEALRRNQKFVKWTFDPMQSRNAHFNLNRLGAVIKSYAANYYGTDYLTMPLAATQKTGLASDRLFAEWNLDSPRVTAFANSIAPLDLGEIVLKIGIPANWRELVANDAATARAEQTRVRNEFQTAFAQNLVCIGFERGEVVSSYLLYQNLS